MDLSRLSDEDLEALANILNSRPRKALGWQTLAETLNERLFFFQKVDVATRT